MRAFIAVFVPGGLAAHPQLPMTIPYFCVNFDRARSLFPKM